MDAGYRGYHRLPGGSIGYEDHPRDGSPPSTCHGVSSAIWSQGPITRSLGGGSTDHHGQLNHWNFILGAHPPSTAELKHWHFGISFSPRVRPSMSNLHFNSKHCPSRVSRRKHRLNFCCAANFKSPQKLPWQSFVLGFKCLFWNSSFYLLFIPFSRIRTTSQPSWTIWLEVSSFSTWLFSIFKDWVYRSQQIDVHIGPSQRTIPTTQSSSASPSFNLSFLWFNKRPWETTSGGWHIRQTGLTINNNKQSCCDEKSCLPLCLSIWVMPTFVAPHQVPPKQNHRPTHDLNTQPRHSPWHVVVVPQRHTDRWADRHRYSFFTCKRSLRAMNFE